jgi:hypothetical protein
MNDASILQYILNTEPDLNRILEHKKTAVFMDSGFRDIYKKLIETYSFIAKMPTCIQLRKNDENDSGSGSDDQDSD